MKSVQVTFVIVYLALLVLGCVGAPWLPRAFWTVLMPIVPIGIVLGGFHAWRRLCPIASIAALGARLGGVVVHRRGRSLARFLGPRDLPTRLAAPEAALAPPPQDRQRRRGGHRVAW